MIKNVLFFIKKDFDIKEHINYVFFDIDGTLSSSEDELSRNKTDKDCIDYALNLGFNESEFEFFNVFDFAVPQKSSLDLFGKFLKETNSKAICISSWASVKNGEKVINELEKIFSLISDEFPADWLIGCSDGCGDDRWESYVKPFIKKSNNKIKHVIFDDGGHEYSYKKTTVQVNPRTGLDENDYLKGVKILND